jgi:hypothetical protein
MLSSERCKFAQFLGCYETLQRGPDNITRAHPIGLGDRFYLLEKPVRDA